MNYAQKNEKPLGGDPRGSERWRRPSQSHTSTNSISSRHAGSQVASYFCPRCKSNKVGVGYPDISCPSCGWSEPLIDFPISWGFHRAYCLEFGLPDPGPCEPPEHTLDELGERLKALEQHFAELSPEELKALGLNQLKEEIDQLKFGLRYTQRLIPRKTAKKRAAKKIVTTEV